jgi:hypothetical protein
LAYNFNDDPVREPETGGRSTSASSATTDVPQASASGEAPAGPPPSAGFARFNSCRWQQPKEEGTAAFCTHREVKPYAGTAGFDADAWCPECQYYKLRRAPKKRSPNDDYSY